MKLKSNLGDKPLWSQVYDIIYKRIACKEYDVDSTLPTEMQFMEEFGVSRITVRQAMDKLISDQLIERKRGKGTIVLNPTGKVETRIQSNFSRAEELNATRNRKIISIEMVVPSSEVLFFFEFPIKTKVLRIVRHSIIDEEIIGIHVSYINPFIGFGTKLEEKESLYTKLQTIGSPIDKLTEEISANIITKKEKVEFKTTRNTAIINRIRKGYNGEKPIEYTKIMYLSDGYKLIINSN